MPPKDAHDIVWLVESWPGGPAAAAFAERPAYRNQAVGDGFRMIAESFLDTGCIASRGYARFVAASVPEDAQAERRAVGAIAEFMAALPRV
jgi:hypothetical protein